MGRAPWCAGPPGPAVRLQRKADEGVGCGPGGSAPLWLKPILPLVSWLSLTASPSISFQAAECLQLRRRPAIRLAKAAEASARGMSLSCQEGSPGKAT